jgi:3-oxoadipate enol-lactonase
MWEMIGLNLEEQLGAISWPTMVIAGEAESKAPPTAAEKIASAIPSAILKLMPDVAHFPPREAPDAFNAFPGGFLAESNAEIV